MKHTHNKWMHLGGFGLLLVTLLLASCGNNEPETLAEAITLDAYNVSLSDGDTATINIVSGNGNYRLQPKQNQVAECTLNDTRIQIVGVAAGITTIAVIDQRGQKAEIIVRVGIFDIQADKSTLVIYKNETGTVTIISGNYSTNADISISVSDSTKIAIAETDPLRPIFAITAIDYGDASVTFTDKKGKSTSITVQILPISLSLSVSNVSIGLYGKAGVNIVDGNGGYQIACADTTIVEFSYETASQLIRLQAKKAGSTTLIVTDAAGETQEVQVHIIGGMAASLATNKYMLVHFDTYATERPELGLTALSGLTYEARIYVLEWSTDANLTSIMGLERNCLLRIDAKKSINGVSGPHLELAADDHGNTKVFGKTVLTLNTWYDVAMTFDGSNYKLYINGEPEELEVNGTASSYAIDLTALNKEKDPCFCIGRSCGTGRNLNGYMHYARIWNRACTDTEIRTHYQNGHVSPTSSGLLAYWLFNNGSGSISTFYDLTNNSFEAQASKAVTEWISDGK